MQFGIFAPTPGVTVGSAESAQAIAEALSPLPAGRQDAQYDLNVSVLQAADELGFDLVLFAERHLGSDFSAWLLAGAVGPRLNRMLSLVAVHPGLWDPVMVGKLVVSLDRMCKGRVALNVVNGWFDEEFRMFGGTVLQGEPRYRRTVEFIDILRGLWSNDTFSYDGEFYKLDKGRLLLRPASPTLPEIYSVSASDRGRDFIAEHCDWWFVEMPKTTQTTDETLRGIEANIADMDRRLRRTGRKVRYAINPFVALGKNQDEALAATMQQIFAFDQGQDRRKIESRMLPATKAGMIGSPDAVLRQLRRFESLGVELVLCKLVPTVDNLRHIAEELIVPMRGASSSLPMAS